MMSMKKFLKGKDVAEQGFSYNHFATGMDQESSTVIEETVFQLVQY
jgi:hypothetical protein